MPVPNPTMPVKGAGTTLWVYKGGDPYANPLSDVD
ncbi:phage tail protein, partial [Escherichia coli]